MGKPTKSNGPIIGGIVLCCLLGAGAFYALSPRMEGDVVGAQPEALTPAARDVAPEAPKDTAKAPEPSDPAPSNPAPSNPAPSNPAPSDPAPTPDPLATKVEPDQTPAAPAPTPPTTEKATIPPADPETPQIAVADPVEDIAAPPAAPADAPSLAPVFDVIRIDRDGAGLVAGRAAPDTTVEIVNAGAVVGQAQTGRDGAFVAYIQIDPTVAAQQLTLQASNTELSFVANAAPVVVVASESEESAPVIFQPAEQGVRLIQPAARPDDASVALDSITYDAAGRVGFAGRAQSGSTIRLYLNGGIVGETAAADDGSWRTGADTPIAPAVYTLRVDQVDATGAVTSRLETPFLREAITEGLIGENKLTVQTGNNLWKLAERLYGAGVRYTLIYQANKDAIRDPDLIYPGQIFTLPDVAPSESRP